ncbi:Kelch-like protein 3 [Trichinella papuae]|uniref:Kelch-like protein 3 n=1 Tax=Trichinella papuae TaxID=268474 RepID=A0A0V1M2S9_9BILA|nr:Kelch-like protein 3 [Trichinella papuae]
MRAVKKTYPVKTKTAIVKCTTVAECNSDVVHDQFRLSSSSSADSGIEQAKQQFVNCGNNYELTTKQRTRLLRKLNLQEILREKALCDVVLVASHLKTDSNEGSSSSNSAEVEIPAHRIILASACPYFKAMFQSNMSEVGQGKIRIHGVEPDALKSLVNFMYTSEIAITAENVQYILIASDLLEMSEVTNSCCEFLKSQLNPSNCIGIQEFAEHHSCISLSIFARVYCEQHFDEVIKYEEYLSLSLENMLQIISSDNLMTRCESDVCEAVMKWIRHDLKKRQTYLPKLFQCIRLPLLPIQYLFDVVEKDELVKASMPCKDLIIGALKHHLLFENLSSCNARPRGLCASTDSALGIIVIGGQVPRAVSNVDIFYISNYTWNSLNPMPNRRCRFGIASADDRIYVIGGFNGTTRVRYVEYFDSIRGCWYTAPPLLAKRSTLGAAAIDDVIYAVGGFDGLSGLNSAEMLDRRTGKWEFVAPMSTRRSSVGVAAYKGLLYAVGGFDGGHKTCLKSVERYDPRINRWQTVESMEFRRSGPGVAVYDGKLFAMGGHDGPSVLNSVEVYDANEGGWQMLPCQMETCRRNFGACVADHSLYLVGGDDGYSTLSSVEIYNVHVGSWSTLPTNMPLGRSYAGVAVAKRSCFPLLSVPDLFVNQSAEL